MYIQSLCHISQIWAEKQISCGAGGAGLQPAIYHPPNEKLLTRGFVGSGFIYQALSQQSRAW